MSKIKCRLFTVGGNYNSTHNNEDSVASYIKRDRAAAVYKIREIVKEMIDGE